VDTRPLNMSESIGIASGAPDHVRANDLAYQDAALQGVSRTFALTIPQLPGQLRLVVGNAYLLCRIADTIEDSDTLTIEEKKQAYAAFLAAVAGSAPAEDFSNVLTPLLKGKTTAAERDLIENTPRVLRITHTFSQHDRDVLLRCVRIMSEGMEEFQEGNCGRGLRDIKHLDAYCYHVAGVVGEMLTALFCAHSPETARRQRELEQLAVSFGQGLQMTNILKDIWDDKERDVIWLPRLTFSQCGFDLDKLRQNQFDKSFEAGLAQLVGITCSHLQHALEYTLLIPKSEAGVRKFCLWAIGMAVLTLRKINRKPGFASGSEVKISRNSVRATVLISSLLVRSNTLLRLTFSLLTFGLPKPDDPVIIERTA
jgi:farnesyl-diphosphate farnesyltransferase